jgi:hypothetical protein
MDERVEAFLADVLALKGEEANTIRQGGAWRTRRLRTTVPSARSQ